MSTTIEISREFVDAIVWGEHRKVWDLMGIEARTTVLKVASDRGMDEALVARLRDGTASDGERDEFLADLINGLRADLAGNDLDALEYEEDTGVQEDGRARVIVTVPVAVGFGGNLPVGSLELATEDGEWRIPTVDAPGHEVTGDSDGSHEVTGDSDGSHEVTGDSDGSHEVTGNSDEEVETVETVETVAPPAVTERATSAHGFPKLETETVEKFGRPMRLFSVAVSSEAMALAWANQEDAPQGATVVVEHEIRASGLHGRMWNIPTVDSLACSMVLRPILKMEEADSAWLVAALGAIEGAEKVSGRALSTWWPDSVIDVATGEQVAAVRCEIQLGPGRVKSIVITLRFDLPRLGIGVDRKDELLEAVVFAVDGACESLAGGTEGAAAAYDKRCGLLGNRLQIRLLPKGETRGTARRIDRAARLELESPSGLVEKITVAQVRDIKIV